jgi:hypothetical protein
MTWSVQWAPFHRSAKFAPTAVQAPGELHETAESPLLVAPAGLGVAWMRHLVPFQASASVRSLPLVEELPAAVHARAELHDTPDSPLAAPALFGVAWMRHLVPFHRSANVSKAKDPLV